MYNNTLTRNALSVNGYLLHSGFQTGFTIDSTLNVGNRRALKHPVRVGFGYSAQLPTPLNPVQQLDVYSYILSATGNETIRDTIYNISEIIPTFAPFEQGLGMGIKSGEIWQWHLDFQTADWSKTRLRMSSNTYSKVFRVASGFQFQPDKQAFGKGTFFNELYTVLECSTKADQFQYIRLLLAIGISILEWVYLLVKVNCLILLM